MEMDIIVLQRSYNTVGVQFVYSMIELVVLR